MRKVRNFTSAVGIAAAVGGICLAGAGIASADRIQTIFETQLQCQTAGNILAQQGALHGFYCSPANGYWYLNITS